MQYIFFEVSSYDVTLLFKRSTLKKESILNSIFLRFCGTLVIVENDDFTIQLIFSLFNQITTVPLAQKVARMIGK